MLGDYQGADLSAIKEKYAPTKATYNYYHYLYRGNIKIGPKKPFTLSSM